MDTGARKVVTKDDIIREAAGIAGKSVNSVRECYRAVEAAIKGRIASARDDGPLSIRVCEGISINCDYIPAEEKKNNLTGGSLVVPGRVRPRFHMTRSYTDSLRG